MGTKKVYQRDGLPITVEQKNVGRGHKYVVTGIEELTDDNGNPIKMPSVTGITSATDGSGVEPIKRWALKHATEYARTELNDIPLKTIMGSWNKVLDEAKKWPDSVLKMAGDRGTRIHKAVEKYLRKSTLWKMELDPEIDDADKLAVCFDKIANWLQEVNLQIVMTEAPLYHKELQVGGTVDMVVADNISRIYVCDFKTGSNIYFKDGLQVNGYIACLVSMLHDGVELWEGFSDKMPTAEEFEKLQFGGAVT